MFCIFCIIYTFCIFCIFYIYNYMYQWIDMCIIYTTGFDHLYEHLYEHLPVAGTGVRRAPVRRSPVRRSLDTFPNTFPITFYGCARKGARKDVRKGVHQYARNVNILKI